MMARIPVKWIRDKAKSAYRKRSECYICSSKENLELHHTHSISQLLDKYCDEMFGKNSRETLSEEKAMITL